MIRITRRLRPRTWKKLSWKSWGWNYRVEVPLVTGPALRSGEYLPILRESAAAVGNNVLYLWKWNYIIHSVNMLVPAYAWTEEIIGDYVENDVPGLSQIIILNQKDCLLFKGR